MSSTASRSCGSNMLWLRRSYQRRCIGASSRMVWASLPANRSSSSPADVDSSTTESYRVTQRAL